MHLDEAKKILKENGFLLEQFDNNYFSKCFKASKLNKLFSIERDNVFRLDGPSFWIVSNKNPGDKYLVRVGGKKLEQYVNGKKVDEIDFGDEYDIILIFKHKLETGKLVNFVNGEMIDYHMTEAKEILKNNGYLVEDFEEDVARKRLNELEGAFDIQGDEANFFDTGFPFAKIEDGRLMLYRPVSVEKLDGENVKKLSIPYVWIDVTEYDEETWTKATDFVDAFRKGVDNFELELQLNKKELEKKLKAINKYSKI